MCVCVCVDIHTLNLSKALGLNVACSTVWQCQGKQDLPGILERWWERNKEVVAWDSVTRNCKAKCSVHPSNDSNHCAETHSPATVSFWRWEEMGFEPMWTCPPFGIAPERVSTGQGAYLETLWSLPVLHKVVWELGKHLETKAEL